MRTGYGSETSGSSTRCRTSDCLSWSFGSAIAGTCTGGSSPTCFDPFTRAYGLSARGAELPGHLVTGHDTRALARRMFLLTPVQRPRRARKGGGVIKYASSADTHRRVSVPTEVDHGTHPTPARRSAYGSRGWRTTFSSRPGPTPITLTRVSQSSSIRSMYACAFLGSSSYERAAEMSSHHPSSHS